MSHPHKKLYGSGLWKRLRAAHLAHHPVCTYCARIGIANDGTRTCTGVKQTNPKKRHLVVDHVIPHHGNRNLFSDPRNLQTLCPDHHASDKQREERGTPKTTIGADGWPVATTPQSLQN